MFFSQYNIGPSLQVNQAVLTPDQDLFRAVSDLDVEGVRAALTRGANPLATMQQWTTPDGMDAIFMATPLQIAARSAGAPSANGNTLAPLMIINLLLERINFELVDRRELMSSLLYLTVLGVCHPGVWPKTVNGWSFDAALAVIDRLIVSGADINVRNLNRETPLFTAARHGCFPVVQRLIERGANANARSILNQRAQDVAGGINGMMIRNYLSGR